MEDFLKRVHYDPVFASSQLEIIEIVKHNEKVSELDSEQVAELFKFLSESNKQDVPSLTVVLHVIAFYLLNEKNREKAGAFDFAKYLNDIVCDTGISDEPRKLAALAITQFANENEKNAKEVVKYLTAEKVVELLRTETHGDILLNIARSMSIITDSLPEFQQQLIQENVVEAIIQLLYRDDDLVVCLACRSLATIAEASKELKHAVFVATYEKLLLLALSERIPPVRAECLQTVSTLLEDNDPDSLAFSQSSIAVSSDSKKQNVFALLVERILQTSDPEQNQQLAFQILLHLTSNELVRNKLTEQGEALRLVLSKAEDESVDNVPRGRLLTLLGYLAINERNMETLFPKHGKFLTMLESESVELRLGGIIVVSNLARREDFCATLLANPNVVRLVELCNDDRLRQLALTTLRNLAIPYSLKEKVGNLPEIFPTAIKYLSDESPPSQFAAVMLLKVLISGPDSLKDKFIAADGLKQINQLFDKSLEESQQRIQFESARLLAILGSSIKYRDTMILSGGLNGVNFLLRGNFSLLHTEAMRVFREAVKKDTYREKMIEAECLQFLYPIVVSPVEQLRFDVLNIIIQIQCEPRAREQLLSFGYVEQLGKLAEMDKKLAPAALSLAEVLKSN